MRPTDIDRHDRRRLFKSLAVSGSLYAILFCIILILPDANGSIPARGHAKSIPLALRLTAASKVAQANAETRIENHKHETGSANRNVATTASAAPPTENSSSASLQEKPGAHGSANETPENETAPVSSTGSDSGNGNGNVEPGESGVVSGAGRADFISWFDSAIRRSLTYPERARKRNLEGTVAISVEVSADGKNCKASVAETSGSSTLDRAALRFVESLFPSPVSPEKPFLGTLKIQYMLVLGER